MPKKSKAKSKKNLKKKKVVKKSGKKISKNRKVKTTSSKKNIIEKKTTQSLNLKPGHQNDVIEIIGYVFAQGSTNVELSNDGSPELAANLDLKGFDIVDSVGGGTLPGQVDALEIMLFT